MQEKSFNIRKQSFHPIRFCTIKSLGAYSQNFLRIIFHNFVENMFSRHIFWTEIWEYFIKSKKNSCHLYLTV